MPCRHHAGFRSIPSGGTFPIQPRRVKAFSAVRQLTVLLGLGVVRASVQLLVHDRSDKAPLSTQSALGIAQALRS